LDLELGDMPRGDHESNEFLGGVEHGLGTLEAT
jgi:hypothetical protein